MFCVNCGTKLPDGAKFCFSCGASVNGARTTTRSINSVQLRCRSCNGVMDVDEDRPILMCPFCGSKEIILEGDKVTIQRIKSKAYRDVELGKQQIYKEVELGKQEIELKRDNSRFKRILFSFAVILIGAILTHWSLWNVSPGGLLAGIILVVAGIVFFRNSNGNKNRKSRDSNSFQETRGRITYEDVELAKIKAKERKDKWESASPAIMFAVAMFALLLMYFFG